MEKNIPGLKKEYNRARQKLMIDRPSAKKAAEMLIFWSARYDDLVTSGDTMKPGIGVYSNILGAYAMREALKTYLKEMPPT